MHCDDRIPVIYLDQFVRYVCGQLVVPEFKRNRVKHAVDPDVKIDIRFYFRVFNKVIIGIRKRIRLMRSSVLKNVLCFCHLKAKDLSLGKLIMERP